MSAHPSEWTLRRLHAGEIPGPERQRLQAHVSSCAECHEVMKGLEANQVRFEEEVPFGRFAAGVEAVQAAARRAWDSAGGKGQAMSTLGVEAHWFLLRKP
ncbi:zf-HC2 domain-containing protein [Archangium violaceum]|uniref:zf-HC2 domain-containing protein n=1 Tax=Archangium violaceum TaxID=83451 RepID=UPI001950869D|nr:zf-HC2 domain-containing protein [Archangium violaceum]QRN95804.1 zf-HC2 domain-containing protein [Archangium violaceum]